MKCNPYAMVLVVNQYVENFVYQLVLIVIIIALLIGTDVSSNDSKETELFKTHPHLGKVNPNSIYLIKVNIQNKESGIVHYPFGALVQFDCHLNDNVHQARPPTVFTVKTIIGWSFRFEDLMPQIWTQPILRKRSLRLMD